MRMLSALSAWKVMKMSEPFMLSHLESNDYPWMELIAGVDYEPASCPACGLSDCKFPVECQKQIGFMPRRSYPFHDEED